MAADREGHCLEERTPEAIRPYLPEEFQLPLRKELTLPWGPYDRVNVYRRE